MFLVIDTETGGLDVRRRPVLTIGYLVVSRDLRRVLLRREIRIKARKRDCAKRALEVNRIAITEHNRTAVTKRSAARIMMKDAERYFDYGRFVLVGHNVAFDYRFLKAMFKSVGLRFRASGRSIDTALMANALKCLGFLEVDNVRLDTLVDHFGFRTKGQRHSALVDATNTLKVLRRFRKALRKVT